jgi:hypothetical protein
MAGGFRLMPRGLEAAYFKRVPQGWVFAAPRPWWLFGPRPTYLLTDTQKAAVAARVRLNRYLRAPWIAVAVGLALLVQREAPGWLNRDSILLFALLWVVAVNACENLTMRRLVAGLPPAAEKISVTDMLTHQTRGASVKTLTALGLFFLAGAAFYGVVRHRSMERIHVLCRDLFRRVRRHMVRHVDREAHRKGEMSVRRVEEKQGHFAVTFDRPAAANAKTHSLWTKAIGCAQVGGRLNVEQRHPRI